MSNNVEDFRSCFCMSMVAKPIVNEAISHSQRQIQAGECGVCIPPRSIFNSVFDEYNFLIISKLFDNDNSQAFKHT